MRRCRRGRERELPGNDGSAGDRADADADSDAGPHADPDAGSGADRDG
jgi:hypothetical protein